LNCVIAFVPTVYYVQTVSSYVVFAVRNLAIGVALLEQCSLQATLLVLFVTGYIVSFPEIAFQIFDFNFHTILDDVGERCWVLTRDPVRQV
jgi:hypothetical protein